MKNSIALPILALALTLSPQGRAGISDLSVSINPNGPSFIAPGSFRDIDVVIRNHGPDQATAITAMSSQFLLFPVGEVYLADPPDQSACGLIYTDFLIPPNQEGEFASFTPPPIDAGSEFRCSIRVIALARGTLSYNLAISVKDIAKGAIDPDISNNISSFHIAFLPPAVELPNNPLSALLIILGFAAISRNRIK